MGSEFVARKPSVWAKKSDTKPSLFTSRPFSEPTHEQNTVNKKELPKEIPPPNYIFNKNGFNTSQPTIQRQEDNSEKEQEPDLMSKSDSPVADEEEKISPQLEDENKEENVNLKPAVDEGDEETISPQLEDENKQENLDKKSIQTKLTVGEPGDKYEQEADTVAAKVVEHINSPKSQQPVQGKVEPVVQPTLMRQGGAGKGTVNRDVEQNIQQARGSGQGLADNVRQPMEQAFGTDFSGVKVHTGGQADVLNRSLNSRAFATGQDIFFKQGEYNPGSKQGQELLAHELTHVVQQGGGVKTQIQRECGVDECCPQDMVDSSSVSSSAGMTSADAPMSVAVFDKPNISSGEADTSPEILEAERELAALNQKLAWELSKAAVDAAGIADPTPISDTVGASMSLAEGDLVGAGLSLISIIPYFGDALGKTAKGARVAKKIANLRKRIVALTEKIKSLNLAKATDKAGDAAKATDKAGDAAKATDKAGDAAKATDKTEDAAKAGNSKKNTGRYHELSQSELEKSEASYKNLIEEHEKKLADYIADPDAHDNRGLLKTAPQQLRDKIINGRIKTLNDQIRKQRGELNKIQQELKNRRSGE